MRRDSWASLNGTWEFSFDDADEGWAGRWYEPGRQFGRSITVPYPPESEASGIGDTAPHRVCWYRRSVPAATIQELTDAIGAEARVLLHVGAADYAAHVWLDGQLLGRHEGGHTPFTFDLTDVVVPGRSEHVITIRCEDDPADLQQPRGKQDWADQPHAVWYHRTTGIWQSVWLEAVPAVSIGQVHFSSDLDAGQVTATIDLAGRPTPAQGDLDVTVRLAHDDTLLAQATARSHHGRATVVLDLPDQRTEHDFDELLWSPEHPVLLSASVSLTQQSTADTAPLDTVDSYLGLRSVRTEHGQFVLNNRPYYLRSVLAQGYWPTSHLAAPSAAALREEVELIKELGFNSVRVHQKIEDPRFLYWCDVLGVAAWGEFPAAYEFGPTAIERTVSEWIEVLRRDSSHPSIVAWVPFNESWGVPRIAHSAPQRDFTRAVTALTRSLDPSRPVISNDGWEHTDSDIVTLHDYTDSADTFEARYGDEAAVAKLLAGFGPAGRIAVLSGNRGGEGTPVMVTEFGGIKFDTHDAGPADTWGYSAAGDPTDFERRLSDLFAAVHRSAGIVGFCYTQLTDTLQEANGLVDAERKPKLPAATIAAMVNPAGVR